MLNEMPESIPVNEEKGSNDSILNLIPEATTRRPHSGSVDSEEDLLERNSRNSASSLPNEAPKLIGSKKGL